jgi:hypothetical protein
MASAFADSVAEAKADTGRLDSRETQAKLLQEELANPAADAIKAANKPAKAPTKAKAGKATG